MIRNDTQFDNHVKQKLYNHQSPVPSGLWEKIVAEKPTEKPLLFWFTNTKIYLLIVAGFLLVGGTYFFTQINAKQELASQNKRQLVNSNSNILNNQVLEKNTANNNAVTNISKPSSINKNTINNNQVITNSSWFNKVNFGSKKNEVKQHQNIVNSLLVNNNVDTATFFQPLKINNSAYKKEAFIASHFVKQNTVAKANLLKLETKSPTTLQLLNNKKIFGLDCPNALPTNWYLEGYGSPDYTTKNIYANGVNNAYLQRIDSNTKMSGGFTFGLRVSRSLNNHFLIKTGLQYAQRNEQFTSKSDSVITTTSVIAIRTIIRGNGLSDTTIRDTSTLQQIGYTKRVNNNHYKSIEVPLLLSYERGNNKWRVALNGGVIINLSSWYNGETLDTTYQLIPLSAKKNNGFYKSNLNLSLYGGVSILRRINNNFEVFAEPYFRYGLSNSNTSAIGYNQRFNAVGLSLGVRYKLNHKSSSTKD